MQRVSLLIILFAIALGLHCQKQKSQSVPRKHNITIVYYAIPGWPTCKRVTAMVHGLEKEYHSRLKSIILDATLPDSKMELQSYGLGSHGMFIYDESGKMVRAIAGHNISELLLRQLVDSLLQKTPN